MTEKGGSGFSVSKPIPISKQNATQVPVDHATKEQQAVAMINQGKLQEAEAIYRELVVAGTRNYIVYSNLAAICGMQGRFVELIGILRSALQLMPDFPEAHYNLGLAFQENGDLVSAITSYNKAIELRLNYPLSHNNLGNALQEQGDLISAISSYHKAIELKSDYPDAHYNMGNALKRQGDPIAAIAAYRKALELMPTFSEAYLSLGVALEEQDDLAAAITSYKKALEYKPDYPEAHFNLSIAELLTGNYIDGLARYEYRFHCTETQGKLNATPTCKLWNGEAINQDSQLLLVGEQGLGDTLQFMRYVIALRNQGIVVSLCAETKLHSIIKASGIDPSPLTPDQANQVNEGLWMPLLSVPMHLEVNPSQPIITEPYIKMTSQVFIKWKNILSAEQRPILGINWQGNPDQEKINSIGRSLPLEKFAPIAAKTNATLLSLQKGFGSEQFETCSFRNRFVHCQDEVNETWDFLETAAIIANCDLVITSDTSVAHLAGGIGHNTWLLLKKVPEWRWGLEGDTTFWYPSMRLFRQKEFGNWDQVIQLVADELQKVF